MYVYVCMTLHIHACLYRHGCMHVLMCVYVYVYDCLCFCMYIYIYIWMSTVDSVYFSIVFFGY